MAIDRQTWSPPASASRLQSRVQKSRVPGALYGSLLLDQPRHRAFRDRIVAFVQPGPPLAVEIGFDHGINLLANARLFPQTKWLGVEIRRRRVEAVVTSAPGNCLPVRLDARTLFASLIPSQRVVRVDIYFPTPALKASHALFSPEFAADLHNALAPSGVLYICTDVPALADQCRALFAAWPEADPLPRAPDLSRRERVCQRDGLTIHELTLHPPSVPPLGAQ